MGKQAMLGSLDDALTMSREVEGVLPCLDFAHLHARPGDGSINSTSEWLNIIEQYQHSLGDEALRHLHIHLSGIEYTAKGEKNHLPLRESDLRIEDLLKTLHQTGCSGRILSESPILEEDALYMQSYWQGL
jgi:deoxyribonuclease-4